MDKLLFGLSVAAIGTLVVFVGLIILILSINGMVKLAAVGKRYRPKLEERAAPADTKAYEEEGISTEVLAAIT
ncbi:MAG: OadG family protein, partial [Clostridia bacterium]|nr:OadG family protein [Clostridia bacterium]